MFPNTDYSLRSRVCVGDCSITNVRRVWTCVCVCVHVCVVIPLRLWVLRERSWHLNGEKLALSDSNILLLFQPSFQAWIGAFTTFGNVILTDREQPLETLTKDAFSLLFTPTKNRKLCVSKNKAIMVKVEKCMSAYLSVSAVGKQKELKSYNPNQNEDRLVTTQVSCTLIAPGRPTRREQLRC